MTSFEMISIDLNADLGEGQPDDEALMKIVSSCNVACGGHAGDADSMARTVQLALVHGVAVGAHPSYPDRDGFGRRSHYLVGDELYDSLSAQAESFIDIAAGLGARVAHLKPHGALYNDAANDATLATVLARVTAELPGACHLVGPPGSALQQAAAEHGLKFVAEGFVDRAYRRDGSLIPRSEPGAVFEDVKKMIAQAVSLAVDRSVKTVDGSYISVQAATLCIHGDTSGAASAGRAIRDELLQRGIEVRPAGSGT